MHVSHRKTTTQDLTSHPELRRRVSVVDIGLLVPSLLGKFASNEKSSGGGGAGGAAEGAGVGAARPKAADKATTLDDRTIQNISIAVKGAVRGAM